MAFDLPTGGATTNEENLLTKIPNSLNALRDGSANYGGVSSGVANAYNCVFTPVFTAYVEPVVLTFRAHQDNAGSATFKADALSPLTIKKYAGGLQWGLTPNDIKSGQVCQILYHSATNVALLLNPASAVHTNDQITLTQDLTIARAGTSRIKIRPSTDAAFASLELLNAAGFRTFAFSSRPDSNQLEIADAGGPLWAIDTAGKQIVGVVPHGRTRSRQFGNSVTGNASFVVTGGLSGDIIEIIAHFRSNVVGNSQITIGVLVAGASMTEIVRGVGTLTNVFTGTAVREATLQYSFVLTAPVSFTVSTSGANLESNIAVTIIKG